MRKLTVNILTVGLIMFLAASAFAVPRLQTYIVGSEYGSYGLEQNSWITQNTSFDLRVAGYWSAGTNPPPTYDWMVVGLVIGVPRYETGSVTINGVQITSFYNLPPTFYNSGFLSESPMKYARITLTAAGFMDNNQIDAWHYDAGLIHEPGWGDEILVDIAVEGFSWTHFDAAGIDRRGNIFVSPGTHDAGFYGGSSGNATPEPGTLSLLGLGLLGLAPFLKKKKRS